MKRRILAAICSWLLSVPAAVAETPPAVCAASREAWREEVHLHRQSARLRWLEFAARDFLDDRPAPLARDYGDIAVIDGSAGVIARRNPFSLTGRLLRFTREPGGYRLASETGGYRAEQAAAGEPLDGIGDDDAREVTLPFVFPFYGGSHATAWVHSDGNITFEQPDADSGGRTTGRLAAGPPRIAALFADLDPSQAPGSIRVFRAASYVAVSWLDVPEYRSFGTGPRQTFQVRLHQDGTIEMAWAQVTVAESVTGLAPGYLAGETRLVALARADGSLFDGVVAERFSASESLDLLRAAQRFYETHEDAYDYLVFFNTAGVPAGPNALATAIPVRSLRHGIGDTPVETGALYGSPYRLQAVLNMGPLAQYPADPYALVGLRGRVTGDTTMSLLGHEAGHLFLALASIRDAAAPNARPMLGAGLVHWSFNFNSEASLLEGNRIADLGAAADPRFLTTATVEGYSPLDQYLMGLRAPEDVPPTFLVQGSAQSASRLPQTGVTLRGGRLDVTARDVIDAEGPRIPDHTVAQSRFRFGFVLITPEETSAIESQLLQLETYRQEFERYFQLVSSERAWADTALRDMLRLSAWPATGVVAGEEAIVTLATQRPAGHDLVIGLHTTHGHIEAPAEVVIPRGRRRAAFRVRGLSPGVADLVAEARSGRYEAVFTRVAVHASRRALRLIAHYIAGPVVLRVADANEAPVSNIDVRIEAPGLVEFVEGYNQDLRTLETGLLWLWWTPPPGAPAELAAEIEGVPESRIVIQAPPR